jgi:hypothetical protein
LGDSDKTKDPINVLVYGASSSLGMYAAQLARVAAAHAGRELRLIGTALKSKHALLSSPPYSYDVLIDYRDPDWPAQVRAATHGAGVQYAVDTISEGETPFQVESTLSDNGKFATFRADYDTKRLATLRIQPVYGAAWEGLGEEVHFGHGVVFPASARGRAFAATFYLWLSEGDQVKIVPNPVRLMPGGLERVPADGLALVSDIQLSARKEGARSEEYMRPISGEKIVYTVA